MTNILVINHDARTPDTGGGVRHYEIGSYLTGQGHNFMVMASSYDNESKTYYNKEEIETRQINDRFTFVRLRTKPAYQNMYGRFLNYHDFKNRASAYDYSSFKPDVVIGSSIHPLAWVAGHRVAEKYGAKYIVEVRDLWPLSMYEDLSGLKKEIVFRYFEGLERKYYRLAQRIITTAPYAYEYMQEMYGIDPGKVYHIPHGIDVDIYDANARRPEEELPEEILKVFQEKFCITYTGALSESEGLESLVQAGKYLQGQPDIRIVIIGSGGELPELQRILRENQLNNVLIFDKIHRDLIPLVLKKSKILFTGLRERKAFYYGISKNKFYDYMASSRPIIFASNVRGSLIDASKSGITIEPGNPELLAEKIMLLHDNIDTLGKEYGANGRDYLEKNHTIEIISKKFLKVIDSI